MRPEEMEKKKVTWGWSSKKSPEEPEWPKDESGENEKAAYLTTVTGTNLDFEMTVALLRSFGVPAVRSYPMAGRFMRVVFGLTGGGMDLYVPESKLDFARELIRSEMSEEESFNDGQE